MTPWLSVVVTSRSDPKLAEIRELAAELPVKILTLAEATGTEPAALDEDGSLDATAVRRATEACRSTGMLAIAEESGLEVDALSGRPGARSQSFAHERATDAENNAALLRALEEIDEHERTGRLRCVLALVSPWSSEPIVVEGVCLGTVARAPRGGGGFGYEPLFLVSERDGRAFAELGPEEKQAVSPRARSVAALRPLLSKLMNDLLDQTERIAG